ncbi:ketopantoate reductase family protein [Bacillus piscicola]|uniref:ketopantoate reductase family protein n=1 Tax=Bacillus piscicola TaxID=1632684 RepID=UPI001F09FA7D|nr:ketopantoate reductase family protein [Bacillus piscicola]
MAGEKVSIIGLGALGILFGQHLSKKMPPQNLRIIADQERIKRYETEQVYSNGERCHFQYVTPEEAVEPADLIIIAVKESGLKDALHAIHRHVGEDTVILSALNGITSEERVAERYGWDKVLYCIAYGMDAVKEGNELTYANMGKLAFGDIDPDGVSDQVKRIARFFDETDFPYEIDTNMKKRMWGKFMVNVGVNQTVAVYRGNYGTIQKDGEARDRMVRAMKEVIALSEWEGATLTDEDLHYWLAVLGTLNPEGKPSMAQDLEAKRFSEVELFAGTVLRLASKHNIPTPVNRSFYEEVMRIESGY